MKTFETAKKETSLPPLSLISAMRYSTTMASSFCITITIITMSFLFFFFFFSPQVTALKAPFSPRDVLPFLPRQVSTPILNSLNSLEDLLPAFVGAASSASGNVEWGGSCFHKNSAWLEFHNNSGSEFGGGTLHIEVHDARSLTCIDLYVFATPYRVAFDYYFVDGKHTLEFEKWEGKAEFEYAKNTGASIFLMQAGFLGTLKSLWEVFSLFTNTDWGENANIKFLKNHMGASFEERPQPWISNINVDDIHSGDFLVFSKIRGPSGAFETLEKWVTGSYAGHTAVCLKDSDGKLWVGESGRQSDQGGQIIGVIPWDEWWNFELNEDDASPHIALLPLHPDIRSKFNETAAWEYALSMSGHPYGYHNVIFSWIDTVDGNYPPPLDAHLVASFMTVWNRLQPANAANIFREALNKRLGTHGLTLEEILVEVEKRGSSFGELLTISEQDNWAYADGKSRSCVAYVIEMYKEAGLFDSITDSVQATEFTIKDAYTINFFESDVRRLPTWCNDGDDVKKPYCQILGKYRMELPGYNQMDPYINMSERCPSLPPDYSRPNNC